MDQTWTKALKGSISDVYSTMFFMVPEEDGEVLERLGAEPAAGWFAGLLEVTCAPAAVRVRIWGPEALARELAANIYSTEADEVSPEEVADAYREMINMVVGGLLTAVDSDSSWKMGLPHAEQIAAPAEPVEGAKPAEPELLGQEFAKAVELLGFNVDGRPLVAGWSLV